MTCTKWLQSAWVGVVLTVSVGTWAGVASVDVKQVAALQSQGALVIDVREPHEYAQSHAPGTMLIPLGQLESRLSEIRAHQNQPVVLFCRSGQRSARAQEILTRAGFTKAVNMEGGLIAWSRAGLPVVTGEAK
ncbi:rhodanese-like domain-containing protein [Rhodoferax sp. U11-2br]|uniref:rhodanese-like domain-containing protein n=1 Tax=Rhodoferax sp. U11-2br TaxID=2838878 RepID=UPI001BE774A1|nr:rhodanese-like domain-containing protein [Rhodoferax sp. U11-2br]MBT3065464.1 rhodanese-like domain-containing protein [Rhodoferax sp. U11-2br]